MYTGCIWIVIITLLSKTTTNQNMYIKNTNNKKITISVKYIGVNSLRNTIKVLIMASFWSHLSQKRTKTIVFICVYVQKSMWMSFNTLDKNKPHKYFGWSIRWMEVLFVELACNPLICYVFPHILWVFTRNLVILKTDFWFWFKFLMKIQ